ncbi:kinesin heavy chain-like isoform X2 [Clytia hemisphaerica]|uniref:Kinesin motor domain-containing protein n=1 Tax=Clytia hemisphaerica TaxID=252671 RepID=A0A7M5XDX8_9CNID
MLTRKESKRAGSATPRPTGSNEIKVNRDSNRVKVYVRVRPFSKDDKLRKITNSPFNVSQDATQLHMFADEKGHSEKTYTFDHVFNTEDDNQTVSEALTQPLVHSAMNGFNGTLMAYGQTGAGKTFSLMSENGITKTMIDKCFTQIFDDQKHNYKVTVSYLQIYQEKIFDLLSGVNTNNKADLAIRENPRTGVYVDNLTDYVVRSPSEVLQYIANGKKKLVFAETKMNRTSSRSHAVLQMVIERTMKDDVTGVDKQDEQTKTPSQDIANPNQDDSELDLNAFGKDVIIRGKIHICDLAGSERIKRTGASGDRLNEAQHINSSLLELGNVIQALADDSKKHVPFRNSVLTRLLQESLGGNCKTSLIVCVSPSTRDQQETKCTLNFGSRAMKVTNTAYVNMEVDFKSLSDQLLKQLQTKEDEIHAVRQSFQESLNNERQKIVAEYEGENGKLATKLNQQREELNNEMSLMEECILKLQHEADSKAQEVSSLEEAVVLIDDNSKREKHFIKQIFSSQQEMLSKNENLVKFIQQRLDILSEQNLSLEDAIEFLTILQNDVSTLEDVGLASIEGPGAHSIEDITSQDFYAPCLKMFLANQLHQYKTINAKLEELKSHQEDDVDGKIKQCEQEQKQTIEVGVQTVRDSNAHPANVELNGAEKQEDQEGTSEKLSTTYDNTNISKELESSTQTPSPGRQSLDLTDGSSDTSLQANDEEREPARRNLKGSPELNTKKSHEIFSGFNSTLNRIEDLVKSDRDRSLERAPSFSRERSMGRSPSFNLGSLSSRSDAGALSSRSESNSYRSSSSLGYRYDDTYSSKYSSPYTTSFSGSSTARPGSDMYESKYSSRTYGNSSFSASKYDNNRSFGGSSLTRYNSSENLVSGGFRGSSSDLSLSYSSRNETKRLEDRIRELEAKVREVTHENQEYSTLVQELSRNFPNDDHLREIKRKVTGKIADSIIMGRKENVKVARIEPFSSENRRPSNSINVNYNVTDSNQLTPKDIDKKNVTYDIQVNVVRNVKQVRDKSPIHNRENLIEFSPTTNESSTQNDSTSKTSIEYDLKPSSTSTLSAAVFNELDKRQTWTEPMKRKNMSRPLTWSEDNARTNDNEQNVKRASELGRLDVNPYKSEEVVFSTSKKSSLALPDWMKLKKKHSKTDQSNHFIKEVIQ